MHMQVECVFEYLSSRMVLKNEKQMKKKEQKINKNQRPLTFVFLGLFKKHLASVTIS